MKGFLQQAAAGCPEFKSQCPELWGSTMLYFSKTPKMRVWAQFEIHRLGRKSTKWGIKYSLSTILYTLKRHFKFKTGWSDFCL